jgi:2-deoxy-D-gluconate 3-dehydrogenase
MTTTLFDLSGRVAVVTGGNGGIGRGIALGFAQAGATVAILGRNEDKNARVLAELTGAGARAAAVNVDLTDRAALEPALRRVEAQLGPVDILVNNAGIVSLSGGILQETPGSWDEVVGDRPVVQRRQGRDRPADQVDGDRTRTARDPGQRDRAGLDRDVTAPGRSAGLEAMHDEIIARTPAGRWGLPEEVAGTAVFLASSASDFVTGETIRVDGGYAIR